jgi:chromosome segregation ATPase
MKMKTDKVIIISIATLMLTMLISGCNGIDQTADQTISANKDARSESDKKPPQPQMQPQRFRDPNKDEKTAVESAIELSRKYADLSERTAELRQQNINLISEKHKLENKITELNARLSQTEKELKEANDMLLDMQIELNNWKANVLGFRDEMRQAEKAELQTLMKIVKLLGGEIEAPPAGGLLKQSPNRTAPPNEPEK